MNLKERLSPAMQTAIGRIERPVPEYQVLANRTKHPVALHEFYGQQHCIALENAEEGVAERGIYVLREDSRHGGVDRPANQLYLRYRDKDIQPTGSIPLINIQTGSLIFAKQEDLHGILHPDFVSVYARALLAKMPPVGQTSEVAYASNPDDHSYICRSYSHTHEEIGNVEAGSFEEAMEYLETQMQYQHRVTVEDAATAEQLVTAEIGLVKFPTPEFDQRYSQEMAMQGM